MVDQIMPDSRGVVWALSVQYAFKSSISYASHISRKEENVPLECHCLNKIIRRKRMSAKGSNHKASKPHKFTPSQLCPMFARNKGSKTVAKNYVDITHQINHATKL